MTLSLFLTQGKAFLLMYTVYRIFCQQNMFIQFNKTRRERKKVFCILKDSNDILKMIRIDENNLKLDHFSLNLKPLQGLFMKR